MLPETVHPSPVLAAKKQLLRRSITNIISVEPKFRGAAFASADHGFKTVKLPARDQADRAAAGACQYGYEGIVAVPQRIWPFQQKNRTRFHLFGDPCFEELQLSCHSSLQEVK